MTNNEFLRNRLLKNVVITENKFNFKSLNELKKSETSSKFIKLMQNRLVMGAFRYGRMASNKLSGRKYGYINSIRDRLTMYEKTGNTETLVDCAALCLLEFEIGDHSNKHFKSIDDGIHVSKKGNGYD